MPSLLSALNDGGLLEDIHIKCHAAIGSVALFLSIQGLLSTTRNAGVVQLMSVFLRALRVLRGICPCDIITARGPVRQVGIKRRLSGRIVSSIRNALIFLSRRTA